METVKLSRILEQTTYIIEVYDEEEKYSQGSGYCIDPRGFLVTAAHVITGRVPIQEKDWTGQTVKVFARTSLNKFLRYEPVLCGITIDFPGPLKQGLQIDLALLRPYEGRTGVKHLQVSTQRYPEVGTQVLMAGFPDELAAPLRWTEAINRDYPQIRNDPESKRKVELMTQELMIKSGMIGNVGPMNIDPDGSGKRRMDVGIYYIDNVMHSGSSGGPVIDETGLVIGTISERAVTKISFPELPSPNKEVPSGSSLAISSFTLLDAVNDFSVPSTT